MNSFLLLIMTVMVIMMLVSNFRKIKNVRKDARYVDAYMRILRDEEGSHENLDNYIGEEVNPELINKSLIVKVYTDLLDRRNAGETVDRINFNEVFGADGSGVSGIVTRNSDSFVWLILDISKAKELDNEGLMDTLYEKVSQHGLDNQAEYLVFKAAYEIFKNKEDKDISFLRKLLQGEYVGYAYDKQLIGFFKKFAATLLVCANEEIDPDDENMLKDFALTQVGNRLLRSLNLLDRYKPEEPKKENNEETPQIEVEENKEEENKVE